jgi:uncharacterized protein (TIGR02391 family)
MPTLQELVNDVDALIAMGPEELGVLLLRVHDGRRANNGMFVPGNFEGELFQQNTSAYPRERQDEVLEAVREAFAWLEGQALIVGAAPMAAQAGWRVIGRRGRRLLTEAGAADYKAASLLPRKIMHPKIADSVYFNFQRGDYQTAVYCAFREVELAVSAASGIKGMNGTKLMREAFKPVDPRRKDEEQSAGPLTDLSAEFAEQEARAHLFAGAFGNCRNPHSHKDVRLRAEDAVHMLVLASFLLRIVDDAHTSQPSSA